MQPHQKTLFEGYPTYDALLKDLSPEKLIVAFAGIMDVEQSLSKKRISLADLTELYINNRNPHPGADYVALWIEYLSKFINVKPLPETRATAFSIYNSYKHFYLTDMKLLLEKIAKAEYGRDSLFFGCVDVQRLNFSFGMYNEERNRIKTKQESALRVKYNDMIDEIIRTEGSRIHEELRKNYKGKELEEKYKQRCNEELPIILNERWNKFLNNQDNDSKEK